MSAEPRDRPQRIAHLLPWPSVGGTEAATARLARAVEGEEFASVAFCLRGAHQVHALFADVGIPVIEYEAAEPSYRHPGEYLRRSVTLARQLRAARVSLVHCADLLAAHRCSLAAVLARVPMISHVRGRFPVVSMRDRTFLLPVDRFVFVSRNTRDTFGYRVPNDRATVLYDGIEASADLRGAGAAARAALGIDPDTRVIGMVARVAPAKDYPTLIRAAATVVQSHPDVLFLVVGQHSGIAEYGEHFAAVQRMLDEHDVRSRFVFTDHRTDVDRLTAAMDVCVLATHGEGLPLVILEAMAQGKPFVATAVGGIPELIRHDETGLLVPLEDSAALAQALCALLDDPAYAARIGAAGFAHVAREFGVAAFATRARALYRDVLSGRGVSAGATRNSILPTG